MALPALAVAVLVACTPPVTPPTAAPSEAVSTVPLGAGAAASRIIVWAGCDEVVGLSDAALDLWRSRGIGGFVCKMNYLYDLGGSQKFTPDPNASLSGNAYMYQRWIRDSQIVNRAAARGIKLWLGIDLENYYNSRTPLVEWFDDAGWANNVVPNIRDLAAGVRQLGFAGVAFDEEMYSTGTWLWDYAGNTHPEAVVRAQVRARGAQFMQAIVDGFPNVDIVDIHPLLPEGWSALVQQVINNDNHAFEGIVTTNFWDGMTSVEGYGAIRFMEHTFEKGASLSGTTWDNAFTYNLNRTAAMFSRRLSNWSYASSRVHLGPFAWIDSGPRTWEQARPPEEVASQLAAFRKWGTGGAFADYAYLGLNGAFDYTPYAPGMQAAATPGVVDTQAPSLTIASAARAGASVSWSGSASDNLAIQAVRWTTASGQSGAAADELDGPRRKLQDELPMADGLDREHPGPHRRDGDDHRGGLEGFVDVAHRHRAVVAQGSGETRAHSARRRAASPGRPSRANPGMTTGQRGEFRRFQREPTIGQYSSKPFSQRADAA